MRLLRPILAKTNKKEDDIKLNVIIFGNDPLKMLFYSSVSQTRARAPLREGIQPQQGGVDDQGKNVDGN